MLNSSNFQCKTLLLYRKTLKAEGKYKYTENNVIVTSTNEKCSLSPETKEKLNNDEDGIFGNSQYNISVI